jgi:hypothetical protein
MRGVPEALGLDIQIVEDDGLSFGTDVLVLKHAQALYGLDAQVVERLGFDHDLLPPPGGYRVVRKPTGVGAKAVLFVGVRPIREFSYTDVRAFGHKALSSVASGFPNAVHIALTLHGVGYGLDEVECFDAEIAGIVDALQAHDYPRSLRTISVLEINPGRAARMITQLESLLETGPGVIRDSLGPTSEALGGERLRSAGADLGARSHAFVAMPFDPTFSDTFHYGISPAVRVNGLLCERIDRQAFVGDILQRLKDQIEGAELVVADLTGANPNVFLEIGFAWGNGVPTVLLCREGEALKFDVQSQRCLFYGSIRELEEKLSAEVRELLVTLS